MAGYSGTALLKKLGIKSGFRVYVHEPPKQYFDWLQPLPDAVEVAEKLSRDFDFIHIFVKDEKGFRIILSKAKNYMRGDGMLWVSWPKKSSGVISDLNENIIRDFGLKSGLVDIKVCAVDDTWSALKFVIPVARRK